MKKFAAIGLGNFGLNLSRALIENGCEVLGIDSSREAVNTAKDFISHAVIGDASNREVLESLSLRDFDGAIVSIGQEMAISILISLYLKEIGVKRIVVRAISEDHGKVLKMIGVSDIIMPERDMAERLANMLSLKNVVDYLPIGEDYGIIEVPSPKSFIGKTLRDLQIPNRFNCQVIGLKIFEEPGSGFHFTDKDSTIKIPPSADDIMTPGMIMIIIGKQQDIEKIQAIK
ncbi:MAG TPA: TrkA family potassium uptake protein [Spirochaetota bacterium]|nr:TrkA family potassium uptake protein [Spirochaetota bacterium]HPJ38103.1 TrkA family potassium uptake protein [Spirochaetota bacterium]HPQ51619.1 TrkA family potassium uptake protein [Spirochaetota bacterium]